MGDDKNRDRSHRAVADLEPEGTSQASGKSATEAAALFKSQAWFSTFHRPRADLLCNHTLDGVFLYVSEPAAISLGRDPADFVGKRMEVFLPAAARHLFPKYLAAINNRGSLTGTMTITTQTGEERIWLYHNSVVAPQDREPYVLGHAQDITDLGRLLRHQDRSMAEHHQATLDNSVSGVSRTTPDGRMLMANRALVSMLGYASEAELIGVDVAKHLYADPGERARLTEVSRHTGRLDNHETRFKKKDGTEITVSITAREVKDDEGKVEYYEAFVRDLTEQRVLEGQLQHTQKMELVGQLAGGMAHDFNNLLTVILANASLIDGALPSQDDSAHADLDELIAAARRGGGMVKRLLTFGRQSHAPQEALDVANLVRDLTMTFRRLLPETVAMHVAAEPNLPRIRAERGAVEQILVNLVTNARDAMPSGGQIRIDTVRATLDEQHTARFGWGKPGDYVSLIVSDRGAGMEENVLARIFEAFYTTKETGKGTGLGMAMVYGLMKQHHGFVDVQSELGIGTTVRVLFPATTELPAERHSGETELNLSGGNETLLLVEDEDRVRRASKRVMERAGYKVLMASNGEDGFHLFQKMKTEIDLIVTDMLLPRMTGADLYEAVQKESPDMAFLFMSGYTLEELSRTVSVPPNVPFIQKPWSTIDFLGRVRSVLDIKSSGS